MTTETSAPVRHQTGIQWTHVPGYQGAVWNPTTGCTRVSPGCDHCYAFALHDQRYVVNRDHARAAYDFGDERASDAERIAFVRERESVYGMPFPPQYDRPFSQVQLLDEHRLTEPLRARKPRAYFVDSMADLFHEDVPDEFLDRVFAVMALSPQHIFMILTKRPERMRAYVSKLVTGGRACSFAPEVTAGIHTDRAKHARAATVADRTCAGPLPNVWLGVSVEDQARADDRIPPLLETPAAVRFLSCEPLLGPVDLRDALRLWPGYCQACGAALTPPTATSCSTCHASDHDEGPPPPRPKSPIDWVIVGGESGQGARPFDLAWARSLRDQCQAAGVALFVKQLGSRPYTVQPATAGDSAVPLGTPLRVPFGANAASHHGNPDEWPEDLQRRRFPAGLGEWSAR